MLAHDFDDKVKSITAFIVSNNINDEKEYTKFLKEKLKSELTKSKIVIVLSFILMYISMSHMLGLPVPHIIYPVDNIVNYVVIQAYDSLKYT